MFWKHTVNYVEKTRSQYTQKKILLNNFQLMHVLIDTLRSHSSLTSWWDMNMLQIHTKKVH